MLVLDLPLDDRAARADLRAQIATLEGRLVQSAPVPGSGGRAVIARGPALQSFAALAAIRDELLARVAVAERVERERAARERAARELLGAMQATPAAHRGASLTLAALGEPGCGVYRVRPRLGLIGRFAGWWHLTLSSGCPLWACSTRARPRHDPRPRPPRLRFAAPSREHIDRFWQTAPSCSIRTERTSSSSTTTASRDACTAGSAACRRPCGPSAGA